MMIAARVVSIGKVYKARPTRQRGCQPMQEGKEESRSPVGQCEAPCGGSAQALTVTTGEPRALTPFSVRLSVRPFVRLSVRPSVRPSVCPSVRPSLHCQGNDRAHDEE